MVALGTHSTHLLKLEKRDFLTECDLAAWFLSIRTGFAIKVLLVVIFHWINEIHSSNDLMKIYLNTDHIMLYSSIYVIYLNT